MAVTKGLGGRTGRSPVTVAVVYPCGHSLGGGVAVANTNKDLSAEPKTGPAARGPVLTAST